MTSAQVGGTYVYAILTSPEAVGEPGSIGIEGGEVYCVSAGDLAAAVSRVRHARLRPERKHLLAHQAVLRRLMERSTVLPAAFGLIAGSDEAVRERLLENQDAFREQLALVAGKWEMGLRLSWNAPNLFDYFVEIHPELGAIRERLRGRHDVSREELLEVGKLYESLREGDREAHAGRVAAALQEHGIELKWGSPRDEREVMSVSCLVTREGREAFEKVLETIAAGFDDHFTFELNGPWAPHSFTELKSTPRTAQE
jgi:hypothetical protein